MNDLRKDLEQTATDAVSDLRIDLLQTDAETGINLRKDLLDNVIKVYMQVSSSQKVSDYYKDTGSMPTHTPSCVGSWRGGKHSKPRKSGRLSRTSSRGTRGNSFMMRFIGLVQTTDGLGKPRSTGTTFATTQIAR